MDMAVLKKQYYAPPDARSTRDRAYSRAVITQGGKTIWLAGQTAQNKSADFDAQVRDVFARLEETIRAVGGNGLHDMVNMTVFLKDARYGDRLVEIRKELFKEQFPASTLVTISAFARPETLIEIQGIAVVD
jgi:enamine deaminase RidA (YjgF/YER057c/UK114 family)